MKRKNNKGFTLIEILAAVVILGIISAIAVPAVYKYVTKTKDFSYENMYKTVYDAVKNYRIDTNDNNVNGFTAPTYTNADINNLVELNYLDPLIDPADRSKKCSVEVYVFECADKDASALKDHSYSVQLTCSTYAETKTFNDNGDLMSSAEYGTCLGGSGTNGGGGIVGDFTVKSADLKYENKNGDDYDGNWTNKKIWIGNFKVDGLSSSDIDHFEYSTDFNNISFNAKSESFGSNAKSYTFDGETDMKFRIRVVDKNGRVSAWSDKVYQVRIDQISPEVTMQIINSNKDFTSPVYKGTATSNTYTYDSWVGKSGSSVPNVRITAKDNKSGVNEELHVNYNTSGDFSNFNTKWNGVSGSKKFNSKNVFTANGLDDGFRVIECTVTDKAGNKTTGTIRVKIDTTPPTITMNLYDKSNNKQIGGTYSCSNNTCDKNYTNASTNNYVNVDVYDKISVSDAASGVDDNTILAGYNIAGKTALNTSVTFKNRANGSNSLRILDGNRYMIYKATDVAGNTTELRFNLLKDTEPPKIKVSYTGNKNNKTMFTADFTATDDENRSKYASSLEYEYDPWINSYNDIIGETIEVSDSLSGVDKDAGIERALYNNDTDYSTSKKTTQKNWDYTGTTTTRKITYSDTAIADGYRIFTYQVKDQAGNPATYSVRFKIDKTLPTGWVQVLDKDGKAIAFKSDGTTQITQQVTFSKTLTDRVGLKIHGEDKTSGVGAYFTIGFNKSGKTECAIDDTINTTSSYSFSDITYNDDDISTAATREIKKAFYNGCRYFKVTLTDIAGNKRTIKIKLTQDTTQATETVKADTNPVGCYYYDYYVRRTGFAWGCTCGSTHSSSTGGHFVVCKHTDGKYYGKKEYYRKVKNNQTKKLSPTLICPYSPKPADGDIANHKYLSKEVSDTIDWSYYGSTVSGKKWSNW